MRRPGFREGHGKGNDRGREGELKAVELAAQQKYGQEPACEDAGAALEAPRARRLVKSARVL
jgi:hypothetical protein